MLEDWTAGTRVLHAPSAAPALVVIADDDALARRLADAAAEPAAGAPVEVRAAVTGPTRSTGELVAEVVFVLGQLGLGAAGNGVWVAVEHLWRRLRGSRPDAAAAPAPAGIPQITRITVVVPTRHGEARVESLTVGPHDGAEVHRNLQKVVEAALADVPPADVPPAGEPPADERRDG